jgi:hypothetical protein
VPLVPLLWYFIAVLFECPRKWWWLAILAAAVVLSLLTTLPGLHDPWGEYRPLVRL